MLLRNFGNKQRILSQYARLTQGIRTNTSSSRKDIQHVDPSTYDFIKHNDDSKSSEHDSVLPFDRIRHSETFGQLVVSDHLKRANQLNEDDPFDEHIRKSKSQQEEDESDAIYDDPSPFRNDDGSFIQGANSDEARLHPLTLKGRVDRAVTQLPPEIAKVISKNILSVTPPDRLRERAAIVFQSLSKEQIQSAPDSPLDCDAHIAALFLQNYSHAHHILLELQSRVGKENFNPQSVLDIGYGPGTGMVALNEIMGDDWIPKEKDVYVVGRKNHEMKKRAKIILSRQINENIMEVEVPEEGEEAAPDSQQAVPTTRDVQQEQEINEEMNEAFESKDDYIGPVNAAKIKIKTKLRDTLPVTKQYDLIMVNQSLLTREYNFPNDIDTNIHMILRLLKPNGHLVLIERGNYLGFETIARARQIMLRPESHDHERGKVPRPYIKGSTLKPQKMKKDDQLITDDDVEFEKELLAKMEQEDLEELGAEEAGDSKAGEVSDLEQEINEKYGKPSEEDLKFEFEDDEDFDVISVENAQSMKQGDSNTSTSLSSESVDYHISIIAPCSHHGKCPLQLGDPKYYKIPSHKHRLNFCSFNKTVERPRYTMELKKGRRLATKWDKTAEDGFGLDKLSRNTLKKLSGTGRPGSNNTETGSFSYLIAQRAPNDIKSINSIEYERAHNTSIEIEKEDPNHWPRIISHPDKAKKNVKLTVSAPSGNIEVWQVPRSLGKQVYHDARKAARGDLWALGKKGVIVKSQLSEKNREKLDVLAKTEKKAFLKEQSKKQWKKLKSMDQDDFTHDIVSLADSVATNLELSKNYKQKGKRAKFDVDPRSYDGK